MRISDWSSDVCSSDQQLPIGGPAQLLVELLDLVDVDGGGEPSAVTEVVVDERARHAGGIGHLLEAHLVGVPAVEDRRGGLDEERAARHRVQPGLALALVRSEEHTSELQSLMHISYAVFCLKKKNTTTKQDSKQRN